MKKLIISLFILLTAAFPVLASNCSVEGKWLLQIRVTKGPYGGKSIKTNVYFHRQGNSYIGRQEREKPQNASYIANCYRAQQTIIDLDNKSKLNEYRSSGSLSKRGSYFSGYWYDVRGNEGVIKLTKITGESNNAVNNNSFGNSNKKITVKMKNNPLQSRYMYLSKTDYSIQKDGVVKVHFNLPGHQAQRICLARLNGQVIKCTSFETSAKTKGFVDFYLPRPTGKYQFVVMFYPNSVTDQRERNRQLNLIRDRIYFYSSK